jgi:DNA topoisomerase-3
MIEKDKGKKGEHGGIGTSATRDTILLTLSERGYIAEQGKSLVSTKIARELYALLPDEIRYPDMTAIWHEQQQKIEKAELTVEEFLDDLMAFISSEVNKVKESGIKLTIKKYNCPHCHKVLRRLNGTKGPFWACSGFAEGCKTTFEDKGGFPQMTKTTALPASSIHKCNLCKSGLRRTKGPKSWFWSCSGYPTCTQTFPELAGKPDLTKPKVK